MGPPPANAYPSGTKLTVGSHEVVIQKYISEGGFAHVYLVEISPAYAGSSVACLKRVAVPDKPTLNILRAEVDAMKRLKGHRHIVLYIDSHAARATPGSAGNFCYEVFVLMEYCSGGGLIDFMNTRLTHKLKEPEVLKIMVEITEGVINCHSLQPTLLHRDIKIENVLISGDGVYKLCDFGSASPVLRPPKNVEEFQILQDDIMRHTTAQYRSPEMVDLYRGFAIDEKADVWALGVFLYKVCYYTTPFEHSGERGILHARFQFPALPVYSDRLKNVISACLREDPRKRPTGGQLLEEVEKMSGRVRSRAPGLRAEPPASRTVGTPPPAAGAAPLALVQAQLQDIQMVSFNLSGSPSPASTPHPSQGRKIEHLERDFQKVSLSTPGSVANLDSEPRPVPRSRLLTDLSKTLPRTRASVDLQRMRQSADLQRFSSRLRPVSVYGAEYPETEDHKGPHDKARAKSGDSHIDNNMDFLRALDKQDSGRSWRQQKTGESFRRISTESARNWKRNSISGLKSFLTGEKKNQPLVTGDRKAQPGLEKPNAALDKPQSQPPSRIGSGPSTGPNSGPHSRTLADTKPLPSRPVEGHRQKEPLRLKRSSSIQRRVQDLLGRTPEPTVKTASGYGKYTDQLEKLTGAADAVRNGLASSPSGLQRGGGRVAPRDVKEATPSMGSSPATAKAPLHLKAARRVTTPRLQPIPQTPSGGSNVHTPESTPRTLLPLTPKMAPPAKPKKPVYLQSPTTKQKPSPVTTPVIPDRANFDDAFPDIDWLTQSFKQRFPSAV